MPQPADDPRHGPRLRRAMWLVVLALLLARGGWVSSVICLNALHAAAKVPQEDGLVEVMLRRLAPAGEALGDSQSVRYIQRESSYSKVTAEARRAIAAYALAPIRVTDDPAEPFTLADFADDQALAEYLKANEVALIAHLGPGLGLLEAVKR